MNEARQLGGRHLRLLPRRDALDLVRICLNRETLAKKVYSVAGRHATAPSQESVATKTPSTVPTWA
jgi:hypothetical protein